MSRSTLLDIRDWLGVVAAFGTVLFLTLAPPVAKPPQTEIHAASADATAGERYALMD
jgi:hypothetical protein